MSRMNHRLGNGARALLAVSTGPSPWILRFAPLVPAGAPVLDLAAGGGRHTRLFLARGHR